MSTTYSPDVIHFGLEHALLGRESFESLTTGETPTSSHVLTPGATSGSEQRTLAVASAEASAEMSIATSSSVGGIDPDPISKRKKWHSQKVFRATF